MDGYIFCGVLREAGPLLQLASHFGLWIRKGALPSLLRCFEYLIALLHTFCLSDAFLTEMSLWSYWHVIFRPQLGQVQKTKHKIQDHSPICDYLLISSHFATKLDFFYFVICAIHTKISPRKLEPYLNLLDHSPVCDDLLYGAMLWPSLSSFICDLSCKIKIKIKIVHVIRTISEHFSIWILKLPNMIFTSPCVTPLSTLTKLAVVILRFTWLCKLKVLI
mgnify:CR=1 FL=1